jgi:hypothetical protein
MLHDATKRGPHNPVTDTPRRKPSSIRRTTTIDTRSPDGLEGDMVVDARGRDVATSAHGGVTLVREATVAGRLERWTRTIAELRSTPVEPALDTLAGTRASSGFRARLDDALPHLLETNSLLYQLLDDLSGASLVAGYTQLRAELPLPDDGPAAEARIDAMADYCAGWAADGYMI